MHRGLPWTGAVSAQLSQWQLRDLLLYEDLLLVLLDHLLKLMISDGPDLRQLVLYIPTMMMQYLAFRQQQLLK